MVGEAMISAIRQAGADLSVRVEAPFEMVAEDGSAILCEGWFAAFGSSRGAVFVSEATQRRHRHALKASGSWHSTAGETRYRSYDRAAFIEMLEDWGWFGAGPPPAWFNGCLCTTPAQGS